MLGPRHPVFAPLDQQDLGLFDGLRPVGGARREERRLAVRGDLVVAEVGTAADHVADLVEVVLVPRRAERAVPALVADQVGGVPDTRRDRALVDELAVDAAWPVALADQGPRNLCRLDHIHAESRLCWLHRTPCGRKEVPGDGGHPPVPGHRAELALTAPAYIIASIFVCTRVVISPREASSGRTGRSAEEPRADHVGLLPSTDMKQTQLPGAPPRFWVRASPRSAVATWRAPACPRSWSQHS